MRQSIIHFNMSTSWCYFIVPLIILGLLRKFREHSWGRCRNQNKLENRIFVVTGANSGIGKETVKELAQRNATVILACRNLIKAHEAISDIKCHTSFGRLIPMELDLASFESIRNFATEILNKFPEIHVLINNAGVYAPLNEHAITKEGFELHFGVNHLGHFLLTHLLKDRLKKNSPSRIIIVTSKLFESGIIDFTNLNGEKKLPVRSRMNPAYCNSKLANTYFGVELAKRMKNTGTSIYMVCPGFTYTGLFKNVKRSWFHYIIFSPIMLLFLRTANQGAQTVLHCATDDSIQNETGLIYRDCKVYQSKRTLEPEIASRLWDVSARLTGLSQD